MISSLVGYTGFVGSNLAAKYNFTNLYNSKNIKEAYGTKPDLLIYAGVRAEKYLANQDPEKDFETVKEAFENIIKINAKQLVLISTIDVYKIPVNVNEDTPIDTKNLQTYGLNRYYLEKWVEKEFNNALIVRLPGLYGKNIKKNFIYDLIHVIPSMLNKDKFEEFCMIDSTIKDYFLFQGNGFFKCRELSVKERVSLKGYFDNIGFSALDFTDSRGSFQFYNLENLSKHIFIALDNGIHKLNIATEPVTIQEIYRNIKQREFCNEVASVIPNYNYETRYDMIFQGKHGYIFSKEEVLQDIKRFVEAYAL